MSNLEPTIYDDSKLDELCKEATGQVAYWIDSLNKISSKEKYLEYYLARQIEGYNTLKQSIIFNANR